jgi:hypothetical protein
VEGVYDWLFFLVEDGRSYKTGCFASFCSLQNIEICFLISWLRVVWPAPACHAGFFTNDKRSCRSGQRTAIYNTTTKNLAPWKKNSWAPYVLYIGYLACFSCYRSSSREHNSVKGIVEDDHVFFCRLLWLDIPLLLFGSRPVLSLSLPSFCVADRACLFFQLTGGGRTQVRRQKTTLGIWESLLGKRVRESALEGGGAGGANYDQVQQVYLSQSSIYSM